MTRGRASFIVAHGRQELLDQAVAAIRPQVDAVMVLDNASQPKLTVPDDIFSMFIPTQPPNLARWWSIGIDFFQTWYGSQPYDLAILCDDAIAPEGWFSAVTQAMQETGTVAGSTNPWGYQHAPIIKRDMDGDIMHRMCSWAFIMDGSCQARADESMHWWWFDSDLDISMRRAGGTVLIGGWPVPNREPNRFTNEKPELAARAGLDQAAFVAKHGRAPW